MISLSIFLSFKNLILSAPAGNISLYTESLWKKILPAGSLNDPDS